VANNLANNHQPPKRERMASLSPPLRGFVVVPILALIGAACGSPEFEAAPEIRFSLQLVAEGQNDSVDMARPLVVRSGPNGVLYVGSQRLTGLPMVLDSTLSFIRTIGRIGEGPGEITEVANLYPKGDSLVVGDQRRVAALFAPNGRYVRTLPRAVSWIGKVHVLRGDTMLLAEPIASEARFGLPFHLIAPDGDTVRSFGSDDRSFDVRRSMAMYRVVTPESDSIFWAARVDRYELQRWHINGQLLDSLKPERAWFPPQVKDWDGTNAEPMPTRIKSIHLDLEGRLLVMIERARRDRPDEPDNDGREPHSGSSLLERLAFMEQLVEIIDAGTGELLGEVRLPERYLVNFVDDGRLVVLREGEDGEELPAVYRLERVN
jgi:hypothetical protein